MLQKYAGGAIAEGVAITEGVATTEVAATTEGVAITEAATTGVAITGAIGIVDTVGIVASIMVCPMSATDTMAVVAVRCAAGQSVPEAAIGGAGIAVAAATTKGCAKAAV
ncbi:MAG: hypothetical protein ACK5KM_06170 [Hyphomicrobiaceae bacterium]